LTEFNNILSKGGFQDIDAYIKSLQTNIDGLTASLKSAEDSMTEREKADAAVAIQNYRQSLEDALVARQGIVKAAKEGYRTDSQAVQLEARTNELLRNSADARLRSLEINQKLNGTSKNEIEANEQQLKYEIERLAILREKANDPTLSEEGRVDALVAVREQEEKRWIGPIAVTAARARRSRRFCRLTRRLMWLWYRR
jgi:hypothetical protein